MFFSLVSAERKSTRDSDGNVIHLWNWTSSENVVLASCFYRFVDSIDIYSCFRSLFSLSTTLFVACSIVTRNSLNALIRWFFLGALARTPVYSVCCFVSITQIIWIIPFPFRLERAMEAPTDTVANNRIYCGSNLKCRRRWWGRRTASRSPE